MSKKEHTLLLELLKDINVVFWDWKIPRWKKLKKIDNLRKQVNKKINEMRNE